jgi:hypothetical protein
MDLKLNNRLINTGFKKKMRFKNKMGDLKIK